MGAVAYWYVVKYRPNVGAVLQELRERVGPHPVHRHAVAQQGPDLDREDGRLVSPLLRELAPPVDDVVEEGQRIRTEPREGDLVVGRHQDVDAIDLDQAELPDGAAEVIWPDGAAGPGPVEALRRQGNPPGLAQ